LNAKSVTFQITGIAASIASIIMLAGDKIEASEFSLLMIHKAKTNPGDANSIEMEQQIEILNRIDTLLTDSYFARNQERGKTKLTRNEVVAMLEAETWMTPAEALDYGFIDKVINKMSDVAKIAAQSNNFPMNQLQRLKNLIARGGRIEIVRADVDNAVNQALNGKKYSALNDEELNAFLATVKNLIEQKVGGTLTDEETANVNSLLNESVVALKETESSQTADGQINALKGLLTELKSVVDQVSKVVVENGTAVEALTFEVTNLKKNARTFGQKPFVNESTKLNIGSAYVDPHARHRQQMKEIEEKTRIQNQKS
jgi:hypothetical protein